jgi:serine protease Do
LRILIGDGEMRRGWLGVALDTVTPERAKELALPNVTGAFVASVVDQPGMPSPAAEAGIQAGDLVLSWNGAEVTDPATLSILVAKTGIGSKAQVAILRDGLPATLEVTVGERPKQ